MGYGVAGIHTLLADIARHRGHIEIERDHLTTALPLFERIGAPDADLTRQRLNVLDPD